MHHPFVSANVFLICDCIGCLKMHTEEGYVNPLQHRSCLLGLTTLRYTMRRQCWCFKARKATWDNVEMNRMDIWKEERSALCCGSVGGTSHDDRRVGGSDPASNCLKCPWARQWSLKLSQWGLAVPRMATATHSCVCVNGWTVVVANLIIRNTIVEFLRKQRTFWLNTKIIFQNFTPFQRPAVGLYWLY